MCDARKAAVRLNFVPGVDLQKGMKRIGGLVQDSSMAVEKGVDLFEKCRRFTAAKELRASASTLSLG
ncbi:MAG: hypothetical protein MZV70_34705 [Desulfobacterales bacterium]|nr:hypothetical protein [Desulfobacterales bacterium]